jgi:hypothetical protein
MELKIRSEEALRINIGKNCARNLSKLCVNDRKSASESIEMHPET